MSLIRTPDERFKNLPDFPFGPNYVEINGARMHYVDEGVGAPILCLHGEPTWSFLYRKMIPKLSTVGRVIAPDLIGFGRSDKYTEPSEYTFQMHYDMLAGFIEQLDLTDITVVVQDWGGLLGLPLAAAMTERFARLVILNTMLPSGDRTAGIAFRTWRFVARVVPTLPVGLILQSATVSRLPRDVIRAYWAPYPDKSYMAGAKAFPDLVPVEPHIAGTDTMKRTREILREWDKPALVMFSDRDPILGGMHTFFRKLIPTANDQPFITIRHAGHFLQEDKGEEIAEHIVAYLERTSEQRTSTA